MRVRETRSSQLVRSTCLVLALLAAASARAALAAGLTAANSQLFFETSANPLHPPAAGDQLGYAVATGDFDGDGVDDLAIGLRSDDQPVFSLSDVGQVQIRFGIAGSGLQPQGATVKYLWQGGSASVNDPEQGDHFGESLAVGDFDGDGFDDQAVYNAATSEFNVKLHTGGSLVHALTAAANSLPVGGDFDGDRVSDFAAYSSADGAWSIFKSSLGAETTQLTLPGVRALSMSPAQTEEENAMRSRPEPAVTSAKVPSRRLR